MVDEFIAWIPTVGPFGVLIAVLAFVIAYPERTEKISGWLLGLFNLGIKKFRQRSIKSSLQGRISSFARSMNEQVDGIMPYNLRLDFVKDIDRSELDPENRVVIVRIRDSLEDDRNLVNSMMAFCSIGVVPQSRRFLPEPMNAAIDVTMTRKLLNGLKHHTALKYLYDEVMVEGENDEIKMRDEFCRIFDDLDESGLFTRVVLEEIRDFGARISTRFPRDWHREEVVNFVKYVHAVSTRPPGQLMQDVGHRSYHISTAFVFIGSLETMIDGGEKPYLAHIQRLRTDGYERAYLTARGGPRIDPLHRSESSASINMASQVAQSIRHDGLGTIGRTMEYYTPDTEGKERKHILIEIDIS